MEKKVPERIPINVHPLIDSSYSDLIIRDAFRKLKEMTAVDLIFQIMDSTLNIILV